jgi:hypothetical protein
MRSGTGHRERGATGTHGNGAQTEWTGQTARGPDTTEHESATAGGMYRLPECICVLVASLLFPPQVGFCIPQHVRACAERRIRKAAQCRCMPVCADRLMAAATLWNRVLNMRGVCVCAALAMGHWARGGTDGLRQRQQRTGQRQRAEKRQTTHTHAEGRRVGWSVRRSGAGLSVCMRRGGAKRRDP